MTWYNTSEKTLRVGGFMWDSKKSILLSQVCVVTFMIILFMTVIGTPQLVKWFIGFSRADISGAYVYFITTIYMGSIPAAIILYELLKLLRHIKQGNIFTVVNIACLRKISWACIIGGLMSLLASLYYVPWLFIAIAAGFVGLIVRVVKNVISEALLLKEEVDYTI